MERFDGIRFVQYQARDHFGVGLTACSAILMCTACLRVRLRHTAAAVLPEDRINPEDSAPEDDRPPAKPVAVTAADALVLGGPRPHHRGLSA